MFRFRQTDTDDTHDEHLPKLNVESASSPLPGRSRGFSPSSNVKDQLWFVTSISAASGARCHLGRISSRSAGFSPPLGKTRAKARTMAYAVAPSADDHHEIRRRRREQLRRIAARGDMHRRGLAAGALHGPLRDAETVVDMSGAGQHHHAAQMPRSLKRGGAGAHV